MYIHPHQRRGGSHMQHFPKNTLISLITVSDKRNFSILITNRASSGGTAGCRALALGSSIIKPAGHTGGLCAVIPHAPADPASPSLAGSRQERRRAPPCAAPCGGAAAPHPIQPTHPDPADGPSRRGAGHDSAQPITDRPGEDRRRLQPMAARQLRAARPRRRRNDGDSGPPGAAGRGGGSGGHGPPIGVRRRVIGRRLAQWEGGSR